MKNYLTLRDPNQKSRTIGAAIAALIIESSLTYSEAEDALACAEKLIMEQAHPVFDSTRKETL